MITGFDQVSFVVDLTEEVKTLAGQVEVLRIAVDDLRQEVEWALRNVHRPAWTPTPVLGSMPRDTDAAHPAPDDDQLCKCG